MYRHKVVGILVSLPLILGLQVSGVTDPLVNLENVAGKVVFYQKEGNATCVRDTGELASDVPTQAMFELFDPQNTLRTAKFTYTWDFGNGQVIHGSEPFVRYNYAESGNYTLLLRVGANVTKNATQLSGVYSMDVTVLDAIRNIELKGPSDYHVSQNASLSFHVDGSPPMWVCWRILPHCESETPVGCTLTMLYGNNLHLNYTFSSTGIHCLDISVRNDVSKLQTSYSLFVRKNPINNLFFILPCVAVFIATFSFITVIACRPRHRSKLQMAASSNAMFLKNRDTPDTSNVHPSFSAAEKGESHPLLLQHGTHYYF